MGRNIAVASLLTNTTQPAHASEGCFYRVFSGFGLQIPATLRYQEHVDVHNQVNKQYRKHKYQCLRVWQTILDVGTKGSMTLTFKFIL